MNDDTLKSVNIDILFLHKICELLVYNVVLFPISYQFGPNPMGYNVISYSSVIDHRHGCKQATKKV